MYAGFQGLSAVGQLTTTALIDALTSNIGRPLKLEIRRGSQSLDLSITACEAVSG